VALAIGLFAGSAQAAPAGGALGDIKANPAADNAVDKTHWRRHRYYYARRHYYHPRHHYHRDYGWWGHRRHWRRHHHWW
jgi:hypothetical protein